jgi:hypothetical protein
METISQLVSESLARNGIQPSLDHLRLEWSRWFRCDSSFSVLLAPAKPGLFVLSEEITPNVDVELRAPSPVETNKRMLALFHIRDTDDLGMAMGRLFLPGNLLGEKLASGRCFARYTVIEDREQRAAACETFQRWMQDSAEAATGMDFGNRLGLTGDAQRPCGADIPVRAAASFADDTLGREAFCASADDTQVRESQPSFSFAWGMETPAELQKKIGGPAPLPSGF